VCTRIYRKLTDKLCAVVQRLEMRERESKGIIIYIYSTLGVLYNVYIYTHKQEYASTDYARFA